MIKSIRLMALGATLLLGPVPALAQDWAGLRTPLGFTNPPPTNLTPSGPMTGHEFILANCDYSGIFNCPAGETSVYYVPIREFARSSTVDSLRAGMDALEADLNADLNAQTASLRSDLNRGIALASSFDLRSPASGSSNRLGVSAATINGEQAFSLNYTRQHGQLDFGLAVARARSDGAAKVGVGFSW